MKSKELRDKWIKALRSGKYEQGRRALHKTTEDGGEFCCLGVACDVYIKEQENDPTMLPLTVTTGSYVNYDGYKCQMPNKVLNAFGFKVKNNGFGYVTYRGAEKSLASLNDTDMKNFADIATIIEASPESFED